MSWITSPRTSAEELGPLAEKNSSTLVVTTCILYGIGHAVVHVFHVGAISLIGNSTCIGRVKDLPMPPPLTPPHHPPHKVQTGVACVVAWMLDFS